MIINSSCIYIVNDIDESLISITKNLSKHNTRVIRNSLKDDFLIHEASLVIKEAYIASNEIKYIILCGSMFGIEAQNSLLKIIEEPPKNIVFIFITTSKSSLLPTVLSRIPHKYLRKPRIREALDLNLRHFDLKELYTFLKEYQRISKNEAKILIEDIFFQVQKQKLLLNKKELNMFSKALNLIHLNSKPISVLTSLMLSLIQRKN